MKALNVNKLTRAGCTFKFWVADWFALMNNKMGGDLKKIQTTGQYMVEVWKAVGMDMSNDRVQFLSSSEEINSRAAEYWPLVLEIARKNSLARVVRCSQIMGRSETDELAGAGKERDKSGRESSLYFGLGLGFARCARACLMLAAAQRV
jgi:tyrosyl-tRNA synthetase